MADLTDVLSALCGAVDAVVYPNGDASPSIVTTPVKIYPGWPDPQALAADLAPQGSPLGPAFLHVSVFSTPSERNTTRYPPTEQVITINPVTYTLDQDGQTISVGGSAPVIYYPQNIAVFVNANPYVVQATTGQAPSDIAAALLAMIRFAVPGASVLGSVLTLPDGARIGPLRVGTTATVAREVRRVEKVFQVCIWADSPANRSAIASAIDPVLSDTPFMALSDGFAARVRYRATADIDTDQKQGIYRRDLFYTVEYATTRSETDTEIVVGVFNIDDEFGDTIETFYVGEDRPFTGSLDLSDPDNSGLIPGL